MRKQRLVNLLLAFMLVSTTALASNREKYNFNSQWLLNIGDSKEEIE